MNSVSVSLLHPYFTTTQRIIFELSHQTSEHEIILILERIIKELRIDMYYYSGTFAARGDKGIRKVLSNLPSQWRASFIHADSAQYDPIVEATHNSTTPVIWNDSYRVFEAHGVGDGAIFPVQGKNGHSAVLAFFMRSERCDSDQVLGEAFADMALATTYFHESMMRIVAQSHHVLKAPLTDREIECLRLIASRKSNWAIAKIFDITPDGASYYVRRLMWKLDAYDRHHAVEKAEAYGLI